MVSEADLAFIGTFGALAAVATGAVLLVKKSNIAQYYRASKGKLTKPVFQLN